MVITDVDLLTVGECADVLRVSPITIRRRLSAGELRGIRLGTSKNAPVRIGRGDLDAFIAECSRARARLMGPPPPPATAKGPTECT